MSIHDSRVLGPVGLARFLGSTFVASIATTSISSCQESSSRLPDASEPEDAASGTVEAGAIEDTGASGDAATLDASLDATTSPDATTSLDAMTSLDATSPVPGPVLRDRSLVWTDPAILDDKSAISLGRVMAAFSADHHGGLLFERLLRTFAETAHSERAGPGLLADELSSTLGSDAAGWNLDEAPFRVTGIHNRIDLSDPGHCGEFRVSVASTHPIYAPFHLLFLFRMPPLAGDTDCRGRAIAWAELSELTDAAFQSAARDLLDELIRPETALLVETVEFTVSPWEWRQWIRVPNAVNPGSLPEVFANPPLFQTVDTEGLNQPGSRRTAFLSWVTDNRDRLNARTILIPDTFRPSSARVRAGVPREPLSLDGIDPSTLDAYPNLRRNIEIMGCPVCHSTDAEFVQTTPQRTFSPFYEKELEARATLLDAWVQGMEPNPPFGPLQAQPRLPD